MARLPLQVGAWVETWVNPHSLRAHLAHARLGHTHVKQTLGAASIVGWAFLAYGLGCMPIGHVLGLLEAGLLHEL